MKKWLLLMLSLICFSLSYGQSELYYLGKTYDEDPFDDYTYFFSGINLLSNNVYLGRKDSVAMPYITPFVGYQLHNGLYGKASVSYAPTKKNGHFDVATIEVGYDRSFGKHILTGISIEKYFYYKNSPGIRASTKENATLYFLYKNEKVEPQLLFAINKNRASDYVIGLSIDHNFRFRDNTLNVYPTVSFYSGSQHYYDDYFLTKELKKDKAFNTREIVTGAGENKPLAVEFSARTTFRTDNWLFTLTPTYVTPLSAATIKLPTKTLTEKLTASFFVSLDVCYRHERK